MSPLRITTIGVYGATEAGFFEALRAAGVDTFCDVRARRGVRGREYAFANSKRLQAKLAALGIRYLHLKELAPSADLRRRQVASDKTSHIKKRQRKALSESFIAGYLEERLRTFNSHAFLETIGPAARVVTLCCVEREPNACHRSLVADRLRHDLGVEVVHLTPGPP